MEELALETDKQNMMPIFDHTLRLYSEKKSVAADFMGEALKRSDVGIKGVYFLNEQELENRNGGIDQRF